MATLSAHGLSVSTPAGWDGEIYLQGGPLEPAARAAQPAATAMTEAALAETAVTQAGAVGAAPVTPILHLANFALPELRGDYGGGAVELMDGSGVFISVLAHPLEEASTPLFTSAGAPWPLQARDFSPRTLQRRVAGHEGCQRFFTVDGRPYCLYVVLGDGNRRDELVTKVNSALAGVRFG